VLATSGAVIGTLIVAPIVFIGLLALAVRLLRGRNDGPSSRRRTDR
jgi:hypothetical protein